MESPVPAICLSFHHALPQFSLSFQGSPEVRSLMAAGRVDRSLARFTDAVSGHGIAYSSSSSPSGTSSHPPHFPLLPTLSAAPIGPEKPSFPSPFLSRTGGNAAGKLPKFCGFSGRFCAVLPIAPIFPEFRSFWPKTFEL